MTSSARAVVPLAVVLSCAACDGVTTPQGPSELFRVLVTGNDGKLAPARFVRDALPGSPIPDGGKPAVDGGEAGASAPDITAISVSRLIVLPGQGGKKISGRGSPNTFAVALGMPDLEQGYYLFPPGPPDPGSNNELTWDAVLEFSVDVPAGYHDLRAAAIDVQGSSGYQSYTSFCFQGRVPDNYNACAASHAPPEAVISLQWDTNVDLDLQVLTPDGVLVEPKHPYTIPPVDGGPVDPSSGAIDRDSNAGCIIDGVRAENLVWQKEKPKGLYNIYANLYDDCKQPWVHFTVSIWISVDDGDGGKRLEKVYPVRSGDPVGGELLDVQANGGTNRGLYVTSMMFN